jgi:diketogulonate reductase-like aldo/keto reductase
MRTSAAAPPQSEPSISSVVAPPAEPSLILPHSSKPIPSLGFGLYLLPPDETKALVLQALLSGYRHLDSASFYSNERAVGEGIRAWMALDPISNIRGDLFITSKVWNDAQTEGAEAVRNSVNTSIANLVGVGGYLDLFLVHWPVPGKHVQTYIVLQGFVASGALKALGVSNYNPVEYNELMNSSLITVLPSAVQIEISPLMYRLEEISFFKSKNVLLVAYKPLSRGGGVENLTVKRIAKLRGRSEAQVLIRWSLEKGFCVLVKTANPGRMAENREVFDWVLEMEDILALDDLTTEDSKLARAIHEKKRKEGL